MSTLSYIISKELKSEGLTEANEEMNFKLWSYVVFFGERRENQME